jgi:hypothetical protein
VIGEEDSKPQSCPHELADLLVSNDVQNEQIIWIDSDDGEEEMKVKEEVLRETDLPGPVSEGSDIIDEDFTNKE